MNLLEKWDNFSFEDRGWVNNKDVVLITYGDSINKEGETPLQKLNPFIKKHFGDLISAIHLLPMFPIHPMMDFQ